MVFSHKKLKFQENNIQIIAHFLSGGRGASEQPQDSVRGVRTPGARPVRPGARPARVRQHCR